MDDELKKLWEQIANTSGQEQVQLFLAYCTKLVVHKEEGVLSEEEVGYKIIGALQFDSLANAPECEAIFDVAGDLECPRISSYKQATGHWDTKTADNIKKEEWQQLLRALAYAKRSKQ